MRWNLRPSARAMRAAQRGLAHARRSDEAQDRPLHVRLQPAHAQVVQDAVLHLLQVVVVLVQDLLRLRDVHFAARALGPRQHRQPLDVVAGQRVVGRHRRHAREPVQLLGRLFLHVLRHAGGFDLLAQLLDILLALVHFAEFLLDRLHLLAQVVVALRLLHLVLHLGLDLVAQLLDLKLLRQVLVDPLHAGDDVRGLQQLLLLRRRQKRQRGGNEVHQPARIFDVQRDRLQLVGKVGDEVTICWNCEVTLRCSASSSAPLAG